MVVPEIGVAGHITDEIIHPAHVPFVIKAQSVILHISGDLRPGSRLFGNQQSTIFTPLKHRIQMLEKFHGLQILMAAINIGYPLTVIFAIIQIQHGSNRIHADSVCMILLCPEQGIGNEEILHLRPSVIIDQGSPVRMRALARILMLIDTASVKAGQAISIPGKMCRNPVQNHANPLLMKIIHKIHKVIRCSVTAGRRIVTSHLISPGSVKRMFHHRHQFHMSIAHLLYILSQPWGNLPVIIEFRADDLLPALIHGNRFADPGTQMQLVNGHRLCLGITLLPRTHPGIVRPCEFADIPHNRCRIRTKLRIVPIRIRL